MKLSIIPFSFFTFQYTVWSYCCVLNPASTENHLYFQFIRLYTSIQSPIEESTYSFRSSFLTNAPIGCIDMNKEEWSWLYVKWGWNWVTPKVNSLTAIVSHSELGNRGPQASWIHRAPAGTSGKGRSGQQKDFFFAKVWSEEGRPSPERKLHRIPLMAESRSGLHRWGCRFCPGSGFDVSGQLRRKK